MEEILEEYPGRDVYLKELLQLFGHSTHCFPSSVYICGTSGTGKTAVLRRILEYHDITYIYIDCIEFYATKMFFEAIINGLRGHKLTTNNNFENYTNCDNAEDFIDALNEMDTDKSYAIILKNFDRLQHIESNILPIMMRFNMLVKALNISCILIGSQIQLNFIGKMGLMPTINVHCEQYSKNDLLKILSKQIHNLHKIMMEIINDGKLDAAVQNQRLHILNELDDRFYTGYFNIFLETFYAICRNSKELVYLSNANFPIYCKPVIDGEICATDIRKLWKNMELPFKMAIKSIYCRIEQKHLLNSVSQYNYIRIKINELCY